MNMSLGLRSSHGQRVKKKHATSNNNIPTYGDGVSVCHMPNDFKIQEFSARVFQSQSLSQSQSHFTSFENNLVYCSLNFINCVNCICTLKWWEREKKLNERKKSNQNCMLRLMGLIDRGIFTFECLRNCMLVLMLVNSCFFQFQRFKWHSVQVCFVTIENGGTLHHISCFAHRCPFGVRVSLRFWRDLSIIAFSNVEFEKKGERKWNWMNWISCIGLCARYTLHTAHCTIYSIKCIPCVNVG